MGVIFHQAQSQSLRYLICIILCQTHFLQVPLVHNITSHTLKGLISPLPWKLYLDWFGLNVPCFIYHIIVNCICFWLHILRIFKCLSDSFSIPSQYLFWGGYFDKITIFCNIFWRAIYILGYHKNHMGGYLKCSYYQIFIVFLCLMLKICKYTQKYMKIWKKINICKTCFPFLNKKVLNKFFSAFLEDKSLEDIDQ